MDKMFLIVGICVLLVGSGARDGIPGVFASKEAPELHPIFNRNDISMNDKIDLMCSLKRGSHPLTFTWYKDNRPVREGTDGYRLIELRDKSILEIDSVQRKHIGNYTCSVTNAVGTDSTTVPVVIEAAPTWNDAPSDTTAATDSKIFIHCSAFGFPSPRPRWSKQGRSDSSWSEIRDNERLTILRNGTLMINQAKVDDAGTYRCDVVNKLGKLSKDVKVTVSTPPKIIVHDESLTVRRGHSITLRCEASGDSPLSLMWTKDERIYKKEYVEGYDIIERAMPGGVFSELRINNCTTGDRGNYKCSVTNPFGSAEIITKLKVLEPPFPPLSIRVTNIESKQVRLNWQAPMSEVTNYIVRFWKDTNNAKTTRKLVVQTVSGSETSSYLADLHPGVSYAGYMLSENGVGFSTETPIFKFSTKEESPAASPLDVKIIGRGAKFFKVQWKPVPEDHRNGKILGYRIGYKQYDSDVPYTFDTVQGDPGEAIVRGLQQGTKYAVVMLAFNDVGTGPQSHRLVVHTLDKDLPGPPNFSVVAVSSSAVQIQIQEKVKQSHVTQFVLAYRAIGTEPWKSVFFPPHTHVLNVEGLVPDTQYEITIASYTLQGSGEVSKSQTFTTLSADADKGEGVLIATNNFLTSQNLEAVLSEPRLFLPLLICITLVISSIVTAYACYKRVAAKYTMFTNPGGPVLQYQTMQKPGATYGVVGMGDREYCVLRNPKLYGVNGGYYSVVKEEIMYDMPYDAVINTSLPVAQQQIQIIQPPPPQQQQALPPEPVVTVAQPRDCYTMLKGKDNRESYIVAPAVPEKDEALRATLRAEKAAKIKKELAEARANGTVICADIHNTDDSIMSQEPSCLNEGTFIQPTENSDPEDTDNDGDDFDGEPHTEPTDLAGSSNGGNSHNQITELSGSGSIEKVNPTDLLMKSPSVSDTSALIQPDKVSPKATLSLKEEQILAPPSNPPASTSSTTPTHLVPDVIPPSKIEDDYEVNWPEPPPPEGLD